MSPERVQNEVENGINSVGAALGNPKAVAPFFRIPGLARTNSVETYLHERGLMTWSADFPADDWKHIQASEIVNRALRRIEAKGRGILLLHDIQPATVLHIVPAGADRVKTATAPQDWMPIHRRQGKQSWPTVVTAAAKSTVPAVGPAPHVGPALTAIPALVAPAAVETTASEPTRVDQSETKSEVRSEAKSEFRSEAKSETKSHTNVASPDTLSATQSITIPRSKIKLRISRPAYLPPLVLSN